MYTGKGNSVSPEPTKYENGLSHGISDMKKTYHPDFGYKENIEYKKSKSGWAFLLDVISDVPKSERMSNVVR